MSSEQTSGFLKWYDYLGFLIHAGAVAVAFKEVVPFLFENKEALIGVLWIIWLTASWTVFIFYRFQQQKKNFSALKTQNNNTIESLRDKIDILDREKGVLERKARYSSVLEKINFGFGNAHSVLRNEDVIDILNYNEREIVDPEKLKLMVAAIRSNIKMVRNDLQKFCDNVAESFDHVTNTTNSAVCIKIMKSENPNDKLGCSVYTFVRDKNSENKRSHEREKSVTHWIRSNTAFLEIYNKLDLRINRCFFCNNLPLRPVYLNTSFEIYGYPQKTPTVADYKSSEVIDSWTLPYFSTIVSPLCPMYSEGRPTDKIIGYLCIDSDRLNVFDDKIDQILVEGIADGIYNSIKLSLQLIEKGVKVKSRLDEIISIPNR